ncbi:MULTISPECIES: hypothetical protein [Vibrio]|uniref:hypothetical protein n=1 Tax=Vibrio TaxID=662 RepID=UPI000E090E4B|nr:MULTISPECIES: hypothetical protein [Vibrio]ROP20066.1 hypothetical protein EDB33_108136 [Vibrio crassostreae]ROP21843.1 hypothetical protein EDB34_108107 [Vibrio crassostreae]RPE97681.1 hypothetical protein EDB15_105142 [Vibrio crassostreae]TCV24034.1 hypothetical protein EDB11_105136 [Vibrio crassostreae]TWD35796.1 hypothetical protein FB442_108136 [Vibrio crassostreae]
MNKIKVAVPNIKYDDNGFSQILKIMETITSDPKRNFDFDFSKCSRLDHHGVVMLGGLARYVNFQNTKLARSLISIFDGQSFATAGVMFDVNSMSDLIRSRLISNNFLSHFSQENFEGYAGGDYIGYREHTTHLDEDNIAEHLNEQWLSDDKVKLSDMLKNEIVSRIFEIFMNAYGHGAAIQDLKQLGVYSCGQYDRKEKTLSLSVLDFGPGIVQNVRRFNGDIESDIDAMQWALVKGNSTGTDSVKQGMPRGLGFDLLSEFVRINEGEMRIYSNKVYAKISKGNAFDIGVSQHNFPGTLVSIKINCDNKHYRFKSEDVSQVKFF